MKKLLSLAFATCLSIGVMAQGNIKSIEVGSAIPKAGVKMQTIGRGEVALNDVKTSKGLLVMFSCNTCPYVIKSQQRTLEMMSYATSHGVGMVIINSNEANRGEDDSYDAMRDYAKKQGYRVPYLIDKNAEVADAFGATRTPEVFLFDGTGKLVYKGAMEDNPASPAESKEIFLKNAIDNMLAKKTIDPNSTKSVGCSIKRKGA